MILPLRSAQKSEIALILGLPHHLLREFKSSSNLRFFIDHFHDGFASYRDLSEVLCSIHDLSRQSLFLLCHIHGISVQNVPQSLSKAPKTASINVFVMSRFIGTSKSYPIICG